MCEWLSCADWCDVRLICRGRFFNAHRVVLASVSSFLRKMLLSCPADELPVFIFLPDFDLDSMTFVLYYIYNGEVSIPNRKLKMFLDTANAMEIYVDQQYLCRRNDHELLYLEPRRANEILATESYKICKLTLFPGKHGYFINVRKAARKEELIRQEQSQASTLYVPGNSLQAGNLGDENISVFGNLTRTTENRQRQSFLRDIFIESCTRTQDCNVNGQTPGVPEIPNEEYHAHKSVLFTDKKHPSVSETLSESSKITTSQSRQETTMFNYLKKYNYRESIGNTKGSSLKTFSEELEKDEYGAKTKCARTESSTIGKVTILNEVLQSPWKPRQPISFTPFTKNILKIYSESNCERKTGVGCKDKNNNSNTQSKINVNEPILTEEQDFKCNVCAEVFTGRQNYDIHIKRHSSMSRYSCGECQKTFSQLRNFKYHMSVHRGTKEFAATCSVCGKHFNDRGYMSNHMKIHRNRKEYKCASCPKSFNQRVAFNMHVRIHTGVKPHVCEECGKAFSRKMLLKQHQRMHSGERPYACAHCDKRFADRSNMTLHVRLHTGVKPFSCNLCPKSFTKKHHLKSHLNFHTGAKPYSCPRCKLAFTQSSNMRTHLKKCDASN